MLLRIVIIDIDKLLPYYTCGVAQFHYKSSCPDTACYVHDIIIKELGSHGESSLVTNKDRTLYLLGAFNPRSIYHAHYEASDVRLLLGREITVACDAHDHVRVVLIRHENHRVPVEPLQILVLCAIG